MDRELLLEIGVEELPAAWLPGLTKQLSEKLQARLKEMRLTPDAPIESFSTPRRLTARIGRMPERQEDLDETITGPPVSAAVTAAGEPTPAALGFAKKQGVAFAALERVKTEKGEYLAVKKHHRGKSTVDALPELLGLLLRDLSFPKQMHWDAMLEDGRGELLFGRPIRWLLYLYGGRVVPFSIARTPGAAGSQVQEVTTGAVTYGHRFLATSGRAGRSVKVRTFDEYRARLPEHFVILEHSERRDRIARELEAKARKLGGRVHLREQAALLDEVADLVEYPGVVAGFFNRSFLELPHEVLTTTLVHHQHYFPVLTDKNELKEAFLAVVNTQPSDERLIAKNAERVVTARLRDARFFWDADRTTKLDDRLDRLHTVVFHKKLKDSSYRDKAQRIETLARTIATDAFGAPEHAEHAATAGRLAKADLVTDMVFEFPELQGVMGGIYAREQGLPEAVWKAIYYHYLPIGVEADAPPTRAQLGSAAGTWAALAAADKADTLVSMFGAGEKPTGSRDPFGLRRNAHGLLRVLVDLPELTGIDRPVTLAQVMAPLTSGDASDAALQTFMLERLRFVLEQRGFDPRNVRAVTHGNVGALSPLIVRRKLEVLPEFTSSPDFKQLATAFKRVRNIARELPEGEAADLSVLNEPAELALLKELEQRQQVVEGAVASGDFRRGFAEAAKFGPAVDKFFTDVFVMVDDPALKKARLFLMKRLEQVILSLADISEESLQRSRPEGLRYRSTQHAMAKKLSGKREAGSRKPTAASGKRTAGSRKPEAGSGAAKGKYVYAFGSKTDGNGSMKALLGGKGANLAEMCRIGLPVPPGFTISTEVCTYYYANKRTYPPQLRGQMEAGVASLEKQTGKKFGDLKDPLLVSVRSGARDSMPGMMDTILNLGLNDQTVEALATKTGNPRFAWDCYRRFVQMYCDVVLGVQKRADEDHDPFETVIHGLKHERYHQDIEDTKLTVDDLKELVVRFKALVKERAGKQFPNSPWDQLLGAVGAVFGSWMNDRAIVYRRKYNIPTEWGTAVNVQAMVYGNTGDNSGSGVAFTRNPANGVKEFYGEFLINAQGEDVVAGVRTPEPVSELKKQMPKAYGELERIRQTLEKHFKDMQDFEFTIEDGVVYMLQTRNGKRTAMAALKISVDMFKEKLIDWKTAVTRNPADQLEQLLAPVFDLAEAAKAKAIATGLPAGPGAASGQIYLNADRAVAAAEKGEKVLLVRVETSPEDLRGMIAAEGILTARGGVSSHAALVARQMGKVCVCGAAAVEVDYQKRTVTVERQTFKEGDWMSIDGTAGKVYAGQVKTAPSEIVAGLINDDKKAQQTEKFKNFQQLMKWCSEATRMSVRTNADTPEQTENAVAFGAVGIGLTRTEHMFFEGDRIDAMREMILAESVEERKAALAKLLPYQREDFAGIFRALKGFPATIRFLDPPLHEFLPHTKEQQAELAKKIGVPAARIQQRVAQLHEFNPMLGFRGCRLGIGYPEISAMQARAVFEAAAQVQKEGIKVRPEVMIPLVGFKKELDLQIEVVHQAAREVQAEQKVKLNYMVGTMIEIPRGALTADEIAQSAEFFSFGTNDLTQTALGMSRDDSGSFLPQYAELEIVKKNPFATIDASGVGQLVEIAVTKGRATRPTLKLGICGEHGGDPASIFFFEKVGLDYVSCSPYRVPVARLAAAQAALQVKVGD